MPTTDDPLESGERPTLVKPVDAAVLARGSERLLRAKTAADDLLEKLERAEDRLAEIAALLRGDVSDLDGTALRAELLGIEALAGDAGVAALAQIASNLREQLAPPTARGRVLVVMESESTIARIATALEPLGFAVHRARTLREFVTAFADMKPEIVVATTQLENEPRRHFCTFLREVAPGAAIVLFGADATQADARAWSRANASAEDVDTLVAAVDTIAE